MNHVRNAVGRSAGRFARAIVLRSAAIMAALATAPGAEIPADDAWPFLRGADGDAHVRSTNVEAWPADGPPVLWTAALGQGYSGFVAHENRLFTQRQTLGGQSVVCLDATTGTIVWEHRHAAPYETIGLYPGPRSTPALDGEHVLFTNTDGLLGCLTRDTGRLVWSIDLYATFAAPPLGFGYASSPVVVDGKVLAPVGGAGASLVAFDVRTGRTVWKSGDDPASYASLLPIRLGGRWQVVGFLQNALVGHDVETGRRLWRRPLSHGYDEHSSWPLYREPRLWFSSPFRQGATLVDLSRIENGAPAVVWDSKLLSNDVLSSVLVGDQIYGFDLQDVQAKPHRPSRGRFRCVDWETGDERWATDATGHASVLAVGDKLLLLNDLGELLLMRASAERFEPLARCSLLGGEICWTPPLLHRHRLYARNQSRAIAVYLGPPDRLAAETPGVRARSLAETPRPVYRDWTALLGVEPEYAMDVPGIAWLRDWFVASLAAVLGAAGAAAWLASFGALDARRTFTWVAFVLAAVGTPVLSRVRGEFTFTWPAALFVAFDACVWRIVRTNELSAKTTWRDRAAGVGFLATCGVYFWLCRRLSLPTEWAFLAGFPCALPVLYFGYRRSAARPTRFVQALTIAAAFTAFYGSTVVLLALWYELPS